jgi:hypothetical protein
MPSILIGLAFEKVDVLAEEVLEPAFADVLAAKGFANAASAYLTAPGTCGVSGIRRSSSGWSSTTPTSPKPRLPSRLPPSPILSFRRTVASSGGGSNEGPLSGRQDLNLRPLGPQPSALPGCATPRGCSPF